MSDHNEWFSKGCEACRMAHLSGGGDVVVHLASHASGWTTLRRCRRCGAYWEANTREAHVIPEAEARAEYPEAFTATTEGDTRDAH